MRYTNIHNVHPHIVRVLTLDTYSRDGADYTTTELVAPAQQVVLRRRHADEIVRDITDEFAAFRGNAIHEKMERHAPVNSLAEERLITEILGVKLGGKPDGYEDASGIEPETVIDYKSTSVWAFVYGNKPEWEAQMNINAYLLRTHKFVVRRALIHAFLYDWNRNEAKRNEDYVQTPFHSIEIPLWTDRAAYDYAQERLSKLLAADSMSPEDLAAYCPCSTEERWQRPTTYAVMKGENKRATKVCETEEQAGTFMRCHKDGGKMKVEVRKGQSIRCENYCDAQPWCFQFKGLGKARISEAPVPF